MEQRGARYPEDQRSLPPIPGGVRQRSRNVRALGLVKGDGRARRRWTDGRPQKPGIQLRQRERNDCRIEAAGLERLGCGPGILGVCIGGDRATGYEFSKQQFLRTLDDTNPTSVGTRVRAADVVFSRLLQLRELVSLEERLSRLEAAKNESK